MPNGYPQDWILGGDDIAKDISEDMVCSICSDLKRDAVITDCKHSFCGDCLAAWFLSGSNTCPSCRTPHPAGAPVAADGPMRAAIDHLLSRCPHCRFVDDLSTVYLHERGCTSRPPDPPRVAVVDPNDLRRGGLQYGGGGLQYGVGVEETDEVYAMEVILMNRAVLATLAPEASARTCQCAICSVSPTTASQSSYLDRVAGHLPSTLRMRVVSAPPGRDFFFVAKEGDGNDRNSNAFIHMNTFTTIVNAIRSKYSCTDRTLVTRPAQGTTVLGVMGRDRAGRLRVDETATRLAIRGGGRGVGVSNTPPRHAQHRYDLAYEDDSDSDPDDYDHHHHMYGDSDSSSDNYFY